MKQDFIGNILRSVQGEFDNALFNLEGTGKIVPKKMWNKGDPNKAQRSGFDGERRNKAAGEYLTLALNTQIVDLISTTWANSSAG